ncbi:MAG: 16S rRNA (cytidine(1402)-2'-O)-methyltransferase, partial [Acinetobacter sp.]
FETIKKMTLSELVSFIENDRNQQKGEIVLVIGGAPTEKDLDQEKLDKLLLRLLEDLSVKAASQLAADLTGIKKKVAYQRALELTDKA